MIPRYPPRIQGRRRRTRLRRTRSLLVLAVVLTVIVVTTETGGSGHRSTSVSSRRGGAAPPQSTTTTTVPAGATGVFANPTAVNYLQSRTGDITAALVDLNTGDTSEWRPGTSEYTASIVKVDILATLLHSKAVSDVELTSSEDDLATQMIEQSDDDAATDLWDDIDQGAGLAAFNKLVGMSATQPGTDGHWGGTQTTADDQIALLRAVTQSGSKVLDSASRSFEVGLMQHVISSQDWGVSAGVPSGVDIALKNGWLPLTSDTDWQVNSIGWIDGDGHDYLLAVLGKEQSSFAYGIATIEGLAKIVWNATSSSGSAGSSSSSSTSSTSSSTTTSTTAGT